VSQKNKKIRPRVFESLKFSLKQFPVSRCTLLEQQTTGNVDEFFMRIVGGTLVTLFTLVDATYFLVRWLFVEIPSIHTQR
jgi:hypothetical protein